MRSRVICAGTNWNDSVRINASMASIVVLLYVFHVNGAADARNLHMNELHQLRIELLENVKDARKVYSAKLRAKRNLMELSLAWGNVPQILSPFGQLPFLKYLYLHNTPKVKQLDNKFGENDKDCIFPSLEVLHIKKLEALEDWFDEAVANECLFPCLTKLCLKDGPNLGELPSLPPNLRKLKIDSIGWKAFNRKQYTSNCHNFSKYILLKILKVLCSNIASLPPVDEIARLLALKNLTITNCHNLIS
ncbi:hypothetical protein IEQ34_018299 [Dendrobium chrysotoxum]|uniref:Uncharacterized protein n=1 Tax=Dendrobium chrysotoxum TaxID=161865 RepID=A0AAV7FW45_DENCH|nr:hypothetical protein IEQ34_018299 [Dendrobium chrysotoxum]